MSFWLRESRFCVYVRSLSLRALTIISAGCLVASGLTTYFITQQRRRPATAYTLQQALAHSQTPVQRKKARADSIKRVALDLHSIPQTLSFFTQAGFNVLDVHRLVQKRTGRNIGYIVQARGSFEALSAMLESLKQAPTSKMLHIQNIERVSESMLAVEFFVKG